MKKRIVDALAVAALVVVLSGIAYYQVNSFSGLEKEIVIELGDKVKTDASDYVKASSYVVEHSQVDVSDVDTGQVGVYEVVVTYGEQELVIPVKVEDTVAPEVVLKDDLEAVVGKEISSDMVVDQMSDLSGIKSVEFKEAAVEKEDAEDEVAADDEKKVIPAYAKYEETGEQKNILVVTDNNDNVTEVEFTIYIAEDYITHVSGIKEWIVEQGAVIDFMTDVTKDDRIAEITCDTTKLDMNTAGEYKITYAIKGDDDRTVVSKETKVTVVTPQTAQAKADEGETVYIATGQTKQPTPKQTYSASYGSSSYGRNSYGGGSTGGSAGGSSGGSTYGGGSSGGGTVTVTAEYIGPNQYGGVDYGGGGTGTAPWRQ